MRFILPALVAAVLLPAALCAQTLDRIKETGTLNLGFRTDAAPLSFLADGTPQGYTPTVCFELASKIGAHLQLDDLEVVFKTVTSEDRFEQVASGEIDLLCGAATITLSRLETVDFSVPIYVDGATVAMKADGPETLQALSGQRIGVRSATTTLEALQNSLAGQNIAADVVEFEDHPAGMAALESGDIVAYFADQSILMRMVLAQENSGDFKVMQEILTIEKQGLALAKGDSDFRLVVDRGLSELFLDGTIREIFKTTIPGVQPGLALEAMFLLSPTVP